MLKVLMKGSSALVSWAISQGKADIWRIIGAHINQSVGIIGRENFLARTKVFRKQNKCGRVVVVNHLEFTSCKYWTNWTNTYKGLSDN